MKVLFLCRGNVGRSVFGEYLYNALTGTHNAHSAGTQLSGPEEPLSALLPKTQFVIDSMKEEGLNVASHVRQTVSESMINKADLVIDMSEQETTPRFVVAHPNRIVWTIDDPKGRSFAEHVRIKNEIREKIKALLHRP